MKTGLQIEPAISGFANEAAEEMLSHARLRRELAALRQRNATLEALFDRLTLGIALVDGEGRLHYRNDAARVVFERGDALVERDGMVIGRNAAAARSVLRLIATAAGCAERQSQTLLLMRGGEADAYTLLAMRQPAPAANGPPADWTVSGRAVLPPQRRSDLVLLLIRDPRQDAEGNFVAIRSHFGLTASEANLLEALTFGERLNDFCRRRGISLNTGKFHLRALFAKTGTHRQADLIRRTIALLSSFAPFGA